MTQPNYTVRLRFFTRANFAIEEREAEFSIEGRSAKLSALQSPKISDGGWLAITIPGFSTEQSGREFGNRLKTSLLVTAIKRSLPVSIGEDKATGGWSSFIKDKVKEETGAILRDSIHGLDVYEDDGSVFFPTMSAELKVITPPDKFLQSLSSGMKFYSHTSPTARTALLMLADAASAQEPLAKASLSISSIELLAQGTGWSKEQKLLLEFAKQAAETDQSILIEEEDRKAVANAISRAYKIGVNEGIRQLLVRLELENLKGDWKKIYDVRSEIFHGLKETRRSEDRQFAEDAFNVSKTIVLKALSLP